MKNIYCSREPARGPTLPNREHARGYKTEHGFNMIEVSLAVAVVAVGLLTLLGLTAGSVQSSRRVSDDTLIANLADDMLNWARTTPYGTNTYMPNGANLNSHGTSYVITGMDANGYLANNIFGNANDYWTGNKTTTNGYYRFTYKPMDYPAASGFGTEGITRIIITVEWPINPVTGAPVNDANKRIFFGQVAKR